MNAWADMLLCRELAPGVMRSLLQLVCEFQETIADLEAEQESQVQEQDTQEDDTDQENSDISEEGEAQAGEGFLADRLTQELKAQWGPAIGGVGVLDDLFGWDHGLLDTDEQGGGGGGEAFGLQDGVWSHSGSE